MTRLVEAPGRDVGGVPTSSRPSQTEMLATSEGGMRQGEGDLWCSYAAVRTLAWLGEGPMDPDAVVAFLLSRQNNDGGFAWQRGLASDIWATYYCTQALSSLGAPVPLVERLGAWLDRLRTSDGGFAMTEGQSADIWATYYATRTHAEVLHEPVPWLERLAAWLALTQHSGGGLAWQPGSEQADVRACYYGALAWRAAAAEQPMPWNVAGLIAWLRDRQEEEGGFAFAPSSAACAWATFRALRALRAVGAEPRDLTALRRWLASRRLREGGFERWPGYGQGDVWACFSVVGALIAVDGRVGSDERASIVEFVRGCQVPGSGFTYRHPTAAGDSLTTAAALIIETLGSGGAGSAGVIPVRNPRLAALSGWLRRAQLPFEGGVMYMPGRGAEVRCTLWAVEALRRLRQCLDSARLQRWLARLQNADGGFGYWQGRASDLVSTASAVETALAAGLAPGWTMDVAGTLRFLDTCRTEVGYRPVPGAPPTVVATAQAARVLDVLGERDHAVACVRALEGCASRLGGFAATARSVPDLITTYQVVLAQQALGLPIDTAGLLRFLEKIRVGCGFAWSPLSRAPGGALATCLGAMLSPLADGAVTELLRLNL